MSRPKQDPETLFWSHVEKTDGGCWLWRGATCKGYGTFNSRSFGKCFRANRLAWIFTHGEVSEGLHVLHRCDNPSCCNPDHREGRSMSAHAQPESLDWKHLRDVALTEARKYIKSDEYEDAAHDALATVLAGATLTGTVSDYVFVRTATRHRAWLIARRLRRWIWSAPVAHGELEPGEDALAFLTATPEDLAVARIDHEAVMRRMSPGYRATIEMLLAFGYEGAREEYGDRPTVFALALYRARQRYRAAVGLATRAHPKTVTAPCAVCGKEVERMPAVRARSTTTYCSRACYRANPGASTAVRAERRAARLGRFR